MKLDRLIEVLNTLGCLSESNVVFRLHVTFEAANKILHRIERAHTNIYFIAPHLVVIKGCEKEWMFTKKKKRNRKNWKDVAKP